MHVTRKDLEDLDACCSQVEKFSALWPNGVEVTREVLTIAAIAGLDLEWWAKRVLPAPAWAAYEEATAPALAAYEEARAHAWAAYEEAKATARAAYEEATAPALANALNLQ